MNAFFGIPYELLSLRERRGPVYQESNVRVSMETRFCLTLKELQEGGIFESTPITFQNGIGLSVNILQKSV